MEFSDLIRNLGSKAIKYGVDKLVQSDTSLGRFSKKIGLNHIINDGFMIPSSNMLRDEHGNGVLSKSVLKFGTPVHSNYPGHQFNSTIPNPAVRNYNPGLFGSDFYEPVFNDEDGKYKKLKDSRRRLKKRPKNKKKYIEDELEEDDEDELYYAEIPRKIKRKRKVNKLSQTDMEAKMSLLRSMRKKKPSKLTTRMIKPKKKLNKKKKYRKDYLM